MKRLTLKSLDLPTLKLNTERTDFFLTLYKNVTFLKLTKNIEEQGLYLLTVAKELLSSKLI